MYMDSVTPMRLADRKKPGFAKKPGFWFETSV